MTPNKRLSRLLGIISLSALIKMSGAHGAEHNETLSTDKPSTQAELVIFLVRHAEKLIGDNPSLSQQGQQRASVLAGMLADTRLDAIYTTDYRRTRETAQATASQQGLDLTLYDPSQLAAFSQRLSRLTGRYLVVGHSNTTTELVTLLGGDAQGLIDDKTEFDRLYMLSITPDASTDNNKVTSLLLRYGARHLASPPIGVGVTIRLEHHKV